MLQLQEKLLEIRVGLEIALHTKANLQNPNNERNTKR